MSGLWIIHLVPGGIFPPITPILRTAGCCCCTELAVNSAAPQPPPPPLLSLTPHHHHNNKITFPSISFSRVLEGHHHSPCPQEAKDCEYTPLLLLLLLPVVHSVQCPVSKCPAHTSLLLVFYASESAITVSSCECDGSVCFSSVTGWDFLCFCSSGEGDPDLFPHSFFYVYHTRR